MKIVVPLEGEPTAISIPISPPIRPLDQIPEHPRSCWYSILQPLVQLTGFACQLRYVVSVTLDVGFDIADDGQGRAWRVWLTTTLCSLWTGRWSAHPPRATQGSDCQEGHGFPRRYVHFPFPVMAEKRRASNGRYHTSIHRPPQ